MRPERVIRGLDYGASQGGNCILGNAVVIPHADPESKSRASVPTERSGIGPRTATGGPGG